MTSGPSSSPPQASAGSGISAAGAIIEHPELGFLLQLRNEKAPTSPLCWGLFGGRIEPGETPEAALWRELYEELQLTPVVVDSWRLVQRNSKSDGRPGTMYIYHLVTRLQTQDLVLGEGMAMRYVLPELLASAPPLFGRGFTKSLGRVLRDHLAGRRDDSEA